ncbi:MAG TPA: restriction endonuclease subunit S [Solirubrobacterales bacterium]|jgi:type I restriction enzyme S subunit|nr:restriction endonuclease subunit S [Solirubrobacterales bacterium]
MADRDHPQIPTSWARVRIRDVGTVRLGRQRSPAKQTGVSSTPYIRAGNITWKGFDLSELLEMDFTPEERQLFALRAGDIVLAEASGSAGQVGRPAVWRDETSICCFQNTVIRFRPHAVLPEYAEGVFRHYALSGYFGRVAKGIGLLHLGARRFSDVPFPVPPIAEQRRIVVSLEERMADLNEGRALLNTALSATTRQVWEILAAAAGEPTTDRPEKGLSHPTNWATVQLDAAGELTLGKALNRRKRTDSQFRPYLRVANIQEDEILWDDLKEMPFSDEEAERYELLPGDILLTEASGSPEHLGRPAMYRGELPGVGFQNHLVRFRASADVDPDFALLVFRHYLRSGAFRSLARGSTSLGNLSRSRLARLPFPLPPIDEQRQIAAKTGANLDATEAQREAIVSALRRTDDLEGVLLAAAASGKLLPQDDGDEPAEALLARLGRPPSDLPATKTLDTDTNGDMGTPAEEVRAVTAPNSMAERVRAAVLAAKQPLSLPELCQKTSVDIDDVGELEEFYAVLRAEIGKSVRVIGNQSENAVLEAVLDAPR